MLEDREFRQGLVLFLDPEQLRADGRSETNAKLTSGDFDYSVDAPHSFILLKRFDVRRWLMTPLFSEDGPDRESINNSFKNPDVQPWKNSLSFIFRWQHWIAPVSAIVDAAHVDLTDSETRRSYAENNITELERISAFIVRNKTYFHPPKPVILRT